MDALPLFSISQTAKSKGWNCDVQPSPAGRSIADSIRHWLALPHFDFHPLSPRPDTTGKQNKGYLKTGKPFFR
ncbi:MULTISPECIES: hypothetical protein [Eikenella]|jgi:hypothetical protein|uniref:Uncharacterized protein n=1 Tax=Eikenella corrodens ATCC 23834 TaxID=546274 RepID=C0DY10_EIKCO|nr:MULTISPECIES: hypothetical protein [Eikenella]EEG23027.1 hypothetical protein EIKCOROL_02272 [Eikenella corrodens ATCC 23834]MDN8582102.1 hypothetical protein [Eikenella corrodens]MDU4299439.1 hypothetical protein [Eikenella corrodens]UAK75048.1 hypothetical protein K8P00_00250 [Eikenella corrodens]